MIRFSRRLVVTGLALLVTTEVLPGQDDYRHADEGHPIRVEDAYPIKFKEWEWQVGLQGEVADGRSTSAAGLELKAGLARNWQLGLEIHNRWERETGVSAGGVEELAAHVLYNVNQEGTTVPAFALRADVMSPGLGDVGAENVQGRLRAIATRTLGQTRLHVNAAHTWTSTADGGNVVSGGIALDHSLGLSSRAILGDVYLEVPTAGGSARVWSDFGSRIQLTKVVVLDLGIAFRLDEWAEGVPNVGLIVGLSRTFGFIGLVDVPPYPNPRID